MKRSERKILEMFNNDNLNIDPQFKRSLKETIMAKKSKKQVSSWRKPFLVASAGFGAMAVLLIAAQFVPSVNFNGSANELATPFAPKSVSAAQLATLSRQSVEKLKAGDVALLVSAERQDKGPFYEVCESAGIGAQPGEVIERYAFRSDSSSAEAYYNVVREVSGATKDFAYYNANGSQLTTIIDSIVGYPFSFDKERHLQVDTNGKPISTDITANKSDNRNVYKVYIKSFYRINDGNRNIVTQQCKDQDIITEYILDANNYTVIESRSYVGTVKKENLIYRYTTDLKTHKLSEEKAIKLMERAGFNRQRAVSEIPPHIVPQYR